MTVIFIVKYFNEIVYAHGYAHSHFGIARKVLYQFIIFLKIGINDVSHHQTSDFIVSRIAEIVEKIKSDSPHTQVYIQSLLPINESIGIYTRLNGRSNQITEINTKLKALAKNWNLAYIDLYPLFTEPGTQTLRANLTGDGLHISEEGYKIWREELKKYL